MILELFLPRRCALDFSPRISSISLGRGRSALPTSAIHIRLSADFGNRSARIDVDCYGETMRSTALNQAMQRTHVAIVAAPCERDMTV
jgi:hypothetical protein